MGLDIEELRKNYENLDDKRIIRLASEEATGLVPEALELLKKIVKERSLPPEVSKAIEIQFKQIDEKALFAYCELLRRLPCPVCNSPFEKLNANVVASAAHSFYSKEMKIACPQCLDNAYTQANQKTLLLGWHRISGIIYIPFALSFNKKMKLLNHSIEPTDILKKFVSDRLGRIELNRDNPEGLADILLYPRGDAD
jgi:uncharacterized protein with PIN domain